MPKVTESRREQVEGNGSVEASSSAHSLPESNVLLTPKGKLLQLLYAIYKASGGGVNTDSDEMTYWLAVDPEIVDGAAVELRKRNLVRFDACDHGLINFRLTAEGIEQMEKSASGVDWHSHVPRGPLPAAVRGKRRDNRTP